MSRHHWIDLNVRLPKRNRHPAGPGRPRAGRYRPVLESLERRELLNVTTVSGAVTDSIFRSAPDFVGSIEPTVTVSPAAYGNLGQVQGLIRFDNIFGTAANQIPVGAKINAAALTVNVGTADNNDNVFINRMIVDWNSSSTWN